MTLQHDLLTEAIETLTEIKRLHQLNIELLEQLDVTCGWLMEHNVQIPNSNSFASLLAKAKTLLNEIQSKPIASMLVVRTADENLQRKRTDKDFTEPCIESLIGYKYEWDNLACLFVVKFA